jgi:hypothetical protein
MPMGLCEQSPQVPASRNVLSMSDSLASVSGSIESGGIVLAQRIMSTTHAHVVMMSCARCPGHHHKKVCVLRPHNEVEYN